MFAYRQSIVDKICTHLNDQLQVAHVGGFRCDELEDRFLPLTFLGWDFLKGRPIN